MEKKKIHSHSPIQTKLEKFFILKKKIKKNDSLFSHQTTEIIEDNSDVELEILDIEKPKLIKIPFNHYNVLFYKNKIPSSPDGKLISEMHKDWKYDYITLERNHGFVQWLFPNFHKSRFNYRSHALLPEEAEIFRIDLNIIDNLLISYDIFLDFLGIQIIDKKKGVFQRTENYQSRYYETFLTSFHNHMRIERLLSHWNILGFRKYAINFVRFLEKEIFGVFGINGFQKQKIHINDDDQIIQNIDAPLKKLISYGIFDKWKVYGDDIRIKENKEILEKNCLCNIDKISILSNYFK